MYLNYVSDTLLLPDIIYSFRFLSFYTIFSISAFSLWDCCTLKLSFKEKTTIIASEYNIF